MPLFNRVSATLQAGRVGSVVGRAFLLQLRILLGFPILLCLNLFPLWIIAFKFRIFGFDLVLSRHT
jgi:hypothetical protein